MSIYSNVKDTTMYRQGASSGVLYRKACSACGQRKELLGGSLFTRLRLWRCAACTQKARAV